MKAGEVLRAAWPMVRAMCVRYSKVTRQLQGLN